MTIDNLMTIGMQIFCGMGKLGQTTDLNNTTLLVVFSIWKPEDSLKPGWAATLYKCDCEC